MFVYLTINQADIVGRYDFKTSKNNITIAIFLPNTREEFVAPAFLDSNSLISFLQNNLPIITDHNKLPDR